MGFLTDYKFTKRVEEVPFPSPFEVTGVSYKLHKFYDFIIIEFPSPLEVTGVSYTIFNDIIEIVFDISVPSRGDWGFLPS